MDQYQKEDFFFLENELNDKHIYKIDFTCTRYEIGMLFVLCVCFFFFFVVDGDCKSKKD